MPSVNSIPALSMLTLAERHVGEAYILGTVVPFDNPNWSGPWDCSEFASWLVYQTSQSLYGCERDSGDPSIAKAFTGWWQRDATQLGQMIPIEQAAATPGAFVLRFPPAAGGTGHIVLSDGTGGTVEARGQAYGVVRYQLAGRRWDTGVLVPGYSYTVGAAVSLAATPQVLRLMAPPMSGPAVLALQLALAAAGFDPGVQDGVFGPHTSLAVTAFQSSNGLTPDGEAGPETLGALKQG